MNLRLKSEACKCPERLRGPTCGSMTAAQPGDVPGCCGVARASVPTFDTPEGVAVEIEALRHDKVESKISKIPKLISPQTIASNSSSYDQPLSVFHANAEEEEDNEYDEEECDDDNNDESDRCSVDSAFHDDRVGYKADEYLTFYVGNVHYGASFYQVGKAFENISGVGSVDQVVIARTSEGDSRGCAFVTVRWKDYVKSVYKSQNGNSESHTRSYDAYLRSALCTDFVQTRICGRRVFVEVARNQRSN